MFARALEKKRNGEGGFTLIELLVVVIIVGILAAVAIPIFLRQQEKAKISAVKSDLKNAAIAAAAYATDNNGSYAGMDLADLTALDYEQTTGVTVTVPAASQTASSFCLLGSHADVAAPDDEFKVTSATGTAVIAGNTC